MILKKYLIFTLFISLIFLPTYVISGGYESPGLGAEATSMGGAFTGVADN